MTNQRLLDAVKEAYPPHPRKPRRKIIDENQVRHLTQQGHTAEQIANQLRCSTSAITKIRIRLGITTHYNRPLTPEKRALIEAAIEDGWSQAEICRTHHVDPQTMRRHYPNAKWDHQQRAEHQRTLRQEHQYDWGRQKHATRRRAA